MKVLSRIRHQLRYGLLTRSILLRLERLDVDIEPYILYREEAGPPKELLEGEYRIEQLEEKQLERIGRLSVEPAISMTA